MLYNLEYLEWFALCGIVPFVPALAEAVEDIKKSIDHEGVCRLPVLEAIFKGWGPYAGLQLEEDWKAKKRKECDITFRTLLILHYSGIAI